MKLTKQQTYTHADIPGNPRKNGIINITEAPSLPIAIRQARPVTDQGRSARRGKAKPIPAADYSFQDDAVLMNLINSGKTLTKKQQAMVERAIQENSIELTTDQANQLIYRSL